MIEIVDMTVACMKYGRLPRTRGTEIDTVIIHRFGPKIPKWEDLHTAADIARAFAHHPELAQAFGRMPYHFVVWPDGRVEQGVPVRFQTPHAYRWNNRAIGVAVVGDFRTEQATPEAFRSTVELSQALCSSYQARCGGHDEFPKASKDSNKVCPGPGMRMHEFMELVNRSPEAIAVWVH